MTTKDRIMTPAARSEKDRVLIFDTTLRDGEQCPGATMTHEEKLEVAELLDQMGVDPPEKLNDALALFAGDPGRVFLDARVLTLLLSVGAVVSVGVHDQRQLFFRGDEYAVASCVARRRQRCANRRATRRTLRHGRRTACAPRRR